MQKWAEQGVVNHGSAWLTEFDFDPGNSHAQRRGQSLYSPPYEPKVLEKKGSILIMQDHLGQIVQCVEDGELKVYFTHPYSSCEKGTNECHAA